MNPALIFALVCFLLSVPLALAAERSESRRSLYLTGFFFLLGIGLGASIYAALS